jgi:DNA-binding transcriptional LysR family regulator
MLNSRQVKLSGIDANLLAALDALLREKSVTRAARRLGVGQPALSHSLARLRRHFNDDLLVLKGRNYVLTDKAEKLAGAVANAARALAEVFEEQPSFDAATSSYRFVVACSDLFGILVIPELLRTLKREAEHVEVELRAIVATSKESILEGGVDLALGIFEDVPASINQQPLYEDPAVCVVRANHEQVGSKLTLETYGKLPHLEIGPIADSIPGLHIDRALAAVGKRRHVTLRVPYYLLAPHILEQTDHVATLSASGAEILAKMARLRVVDPPIKLPRYQFSQIWRNTHNDDRAHAWLRGWIASICQRQALAFSHP